MVIKQKLKQYDNFKSPGGIVRHAFFQKEELNINIMRLRHYKNAQEQLDNDINWNEVVKLHIIMKNS